MKTFAWLRARPRTLASAAVVTASAVAVAAMAFLYQGNPTTEVDLNDGGVWVTKTSTMLVGHFNHPSALLDGGLRTATDAYDVLQSGDTVLVHDPEGSVTVIDPALVVMTDSATVPAGAKVALGGKTVAVLDPGSGSLWVVSAAAAGSFQTDGEKPLAKLGAGADVAVGTDGTVYAVSTERGALVTVRVDADGTPEKPSEARLEGLAEDAVATITAAGTTPVVLDARSGELFGPGGSLAQVADADSAVLQQPSATADTVAVATADRVVEVPIGGGEPKVTTLEASGLPAAPVTLNGCVYAAWAVSATFRRDCVGEADDLATDLVGLDDRTQLTFRVNRDVVVLNDAVGGLAWMASEDMRQVDNWDDITPPEGEAEDSDDETSEETVETTLPERSERNTPPEAKDDSYGVRPGRTTILPVLDNDNDADGDVLTVTLPDGDPALGPVQSINNGSGLQITVPDDATGRESFAYEVDDGRGGVDRARVTLAVHDWSVNGAPTQKRITVVAVESGGVVTYNVLPDWIDPDGDDIFLGTVDPLPGDEVDFTADGRITYRAISGVQGRKDIPIVVSDGNGGVTEGVLRLDIRPAGTTTPVTTADHVVVPVGDSVTVSPLLNDISSGSDPLRLSRVEDVDGADIGFDPAGGTFTFSAKAAGTYYVQYMVSAGGAGVPGIVRVDVVERRDTDDPPIAVRDVALLPSGGEVVVDVLANDIDPAGGILVVQSVTVPESSGISVSVLNHATLRIADQAALGEQVVVSYRISNGTGTAEGSVVVIPVPGPSKVRAPVATEDQATVRVGDVVTIPVLANDYSPSGAAIHLSPTLVPPVPGPDEGEIFVSEDTLRFRASDTAGSVYATYQVVDATGQKDSALVKIQVLPMNEQTNAAPRPLDVVARVLSGTTVRIPIDLNGIDPDGDSVELVGVADAPTKGRIEVGADYLAYEALADSVGTDRFTYRVRDRLGKEATATVLVGIAPAEAVNQAPYAVKDAVVMRPGRSVAVPVLTNDSDPDGDSFGLVTNGLVLPEVAGLDAEVVGDRVVVTAPDEPVETSVQYTIRDTRGAQAMAVLQVTVKPDVPLVPPVARDDRVRPEDIDSATVDVAVLDNDEDPDGTREALTVTVADEGAKVLADGVMRITLTDEARLLTYTVADVDGLTASAFVFVPSLDGLPPTLVSTEPVEVRSGETKELPLAEYVRASGSRSVVITEAAKASALHGDGSALVKDQSTLVYRSAEGYYGQDAVTFEVTDGAGPDDPDGRKATLTIPITVLPPENQSPTFTDGQLDVAPGEEPGSLDLAALTTDPDPGDVAAMRYTIVGGATDGVSAQIDGQTLRASAATATAKGTTAQLRIRVEDGQSPAVEGSVRVRVTASTRPLPTANDDVVAEAHQGVVTSVSARDNDFNPFPETPLKITAASVETGQGEVVSFDDGVVRIQPDDTFVGRMVVRYRVQDATGDVDREVDGRIHLTVQGRPDAPGKPTVVSVQDRTVVLSWTPPVDNGAEITGYTVTSAKKDYSKQCVATTCTLDGLVNNREYNFTVTATNRVGVSDPSLPSETARPDARPDTPDPPTLVFGDSSLEVAWVTPSTPGSPVESFTLEISPAPPSGVTQKTGQKGNAVVWEGLENGVAYQVRVRAHNRAPDPSEWSQWSATEIPAREPDAPAAPTVTRLQPVGTQSQLRVAWSAPDANGDAVSGYELDVLRGSSVVRTIEVSGTQTSQAVTVDNSTTDYTFRVRASNKAGTGAWSSQSSALRAFGSASAPTNVVATAGDDSVSVTYTAPSGNGATSSELEYEFSVNNGDWRSDWNGKVITSGVPNNGSYSVRVRAYASIDGVRYDGAASAASNTVEPYGAIGTPSASASASGTTISYTWSAPARNGRDIVKMEIRIDSGSWKTVADSGSTSDSYGYSETHKITVRATDAEGQTSTKSASATTQDAPEPKAWTTKGASGTWATCTHSSCAYLVVNTENFTAGTYTVQCWRENGGQFSSSTKSLPANGSLQLGCYFGNPGETAWVRIVGWGDADGLTWY
ncbi:MAG: Ig-like domain-containing protein [Microbacterium sp.]